MQRITIENLWYLAYSSQDPFWSDLYKEVVAATPGGENGLCWGSVINVPVHQFSTTSKTAKLPSIFKVEGSERPGKADTETWRDRAIRDPIF